MGVSWRSAGIIVANEDQKQKIKNFIEKEGEVGYAPLDMIDYNEPNIINLNSGGYGVFTITGGRETELDDYTDNEWGNLEEALRDKGFKFKMAEYASNMQSDTGNFLVYSDGSFEEVDMEAESAIIGNTLLDMINKREIPEESLQEILNELVENIQEIDPDIWNETDTNLFTIYWKVI